MFPNLFRPRLRRAAADYERGFVAAVRLAEASARNPGMERLIAIFWVVIAVKCVLVWWLIRHYHVPFHPMWVVAPTLLFAAVCTAVYAWRD